MATSKKDSGSAQVPPTRAMGRGTATGEALVEAEGRELPTGKDRGSTAPGAGEATAPGDAPKGSQAKPAKFTSNGSLPNRQLPTPSGPVPASAIHKTKDAADQAVDQNSEAIDAAQEGSYGIGGQRLSEATVGRLGRAELQAIAHTRGYGIDPMLGTRGTRNAFLRAQDGDKTLSGKEAGATYEGRSGGAASNRPKGPKAKSSRRARRDR